MTEPLPLDDWPPLDAGRPPAGRALLDWAADAGVERLCVVTGSAGTGKSQLLAWFASGHRWHEVSTVNALVACEGLGLAPAVWLLSHQLHYGARSVAELLDTAVRDRRPVLVALSDLHLLDTAGKRPGSLFVPEVVEQLLTLPWVRVLAEVRDPANAGFDTPSRVIDLDDPAMTDRDGYAAWYTGLAGPAPAVPADAVFPHPVLGHLAADLPPGAAPSAGPEGRTDGQELCAAWWAGQDPEVRGALRTLALARDWMDVVTWRLLHAGLHPDDPGAAAAVDRAAGRLPWQQVEFRMPLPRLLTLARHDDGSGEPFPDRERAFDVLLGLVPRDGRGRPDWEHAPRYVLDHILAHAPEPRAVSTLLSDPGFLVHAAPEAITRALDDRKVATPPSLRAAWYPAAPALQQGLPSAAQRVAALYTSALAAAPRLAELLAPAARANPTTARWTLPRLAMPLLDGRPAEASWPGAISALAPGADATVVAADTLGQVRTLNTATGAVVGRTVNTPVTGATGLLRLTDDGFVLLDHAGTVRTVGAVDPALAADLAATGGRATCLGAAPDGGTLVLGDEAGTVRLFGVRDGEPVRLTERLAEVPLTAVGCLRADDGDHVVVAGAADGSITLWAPPKPPLDRPLTFREAEPVAIASAATRVGPVIAIAWSDHVVSVRRLAYGPAHEVHPYHDVLALAITPDGALVVAGYDGITCWECDLDALA